jgi:N-acetylglucosamine kinase-like BadF-type ATPase
VAAGAWPAATIVSAGTSAHHRGQHVTVATIDGGKSALRLRIVADGRQAEGRGPGFTFGSDPDSDRRSMTEAIGIALAEARRALPELAAQPAADVAFVGLTGLPGEAEQVAMLEAELSVDLARRVFVVDDGLLAHAGALGGPGTVASVGTGINITTITADGTAVVHDAWGPVIGDRGSAYAIGLAGIRAVAASLDGAGPPTELADHLGELMGGRIRSLETLQRFTRRPDITSRIASFAEQVLTLASGGDAVARAISDAAAGELAATLSAAAALEHPITWSGRLLDAHPAYLSAIIAACPPEVAARIQAPRGTALDAGPVLERALDDPADPYHLTFRRDATA